MIYLFIAFLDNHHRQHHHHQHQHRANPMDSMIKIWEYCLHNVLTTIFAIQLRSIDMDAP
jgi:hypothetical protein